jgi:transposase-like protein
MSSSINVLKLADTLRTEGDAYRYLEDLRWGGRPVCPHCGSVRKPYFLKPANGSSRKTTRGAASERRVWKCSEKGCRKQFSATTGTVMHGSKIPIRTWIFVIFEMVSSKNGVAAREIERKYGLASKSAWHMMHRIREAMKRDPLAGLLSGRVAADETYYGGKPHNRHGYVPTKGPKGDDKTIIMALVDRETGEARSQVIADVKSTTLRSVLWEQTDRASTHLQTDQLPAYKSVGKSFAQHSSVDHGRREYARGDVTTNAVESYFAQLQRSLDGTHHHVSVEHLPRYLAEFDLRASTCKLTDTERMNVVIGRVGGRRLSYRKPANLQA